MKNNPEILRNQSKGFTLIEVMITCVIISILMAIGWPMYQNYVIKSRRSASVLCLMEYSQYMERFYNSNLSYSTDTSGNPNTLPAFSCATSVSDFYTFSLPSSSATAYTLRATPKGVQSQKDTECGTLSLQSTGSRTASGGGSKCWK